MRRGEVVDLASDNEHRETGALTINWPLRGMGSAFRESVAAAGPPQATVRPGTFHALRNVTDTLNVVRQDPWRQLRQLPDTDITRRFNGAR